MIRPVTMHDAADIARIYAHYVQNTTITFELKAPPVPEIRDRIRKCTYQYPWLVCEAEGKVTGYAYAYRFREREAYRFTSELTIYLDHEVTRKGTGTALYQALIGKMKETNVAVLMGCIALPNEASVRLHENLGFKNVAMLRNVGFKMDRWIDVGYWELQIRDTTKYRP